MIDKKSLLTFIFALMLVLVGCSNDLKEETSGDNGPNGKLEQTILVQKRVDDSNTYENMQEIVHASDVNKVTDILDQINWEKAVVDMARPADFQFNNTKKEEIYQLWISPNQEKLEIVREPDGYAQLTKEHSSLLFEVIIGEKLETYPSVDSENNEAAEEESIYPKGALQKVDSELLSNKGELLARVEKIHDYIGIEYDENEVEEIAQEPKYNDKHFTVEQFVQKKLNEKIEIVERMDEKTVMVVTENSYVFKLMLQFNEKHEVWLISAVGAL
ncbi:hypothetical protein [Gracilibacillus sp. YIM 98692]|uniref:hypothetical protein n=1 Tax=Gracilibacillus sp. YIM 98692 TaxID=2663532 RepID=UPI0013D46ED1|nr:hypothetical protein [Gracilibacillus sp. YIM 98692]